MSTIAVNAGLARPGCRPAPLSPRAFIAFAALAGKAAGIDGEIQDEERRAFIAGLTGYDRPIRRMAEAIFTRAARTRDGWRGHARSIRRALPGERSARLQLFEALVAILAAKGSLIDRERAFLRLIGRALGLAYHDHRRVLDDHRRPALGGMSRREALAVLGLPPDADLDTARRAFRRLVKQAHPDTAGDARPATDPVRLIAAWNTVKHPARPGG